MSIDDWTERFDGTRCLPRKVRDRLIQVAKVRIFKEGEQLFGPENRPGSLLFLYEGTIRVSQASENGREIVLYRIEAGESCVLTTACMLTEEAYNARGIAQTNVTIVTLPRFSFDQLASDEPEFRNFVFAAYSRRLITLLRVVDDVVFGRMDVRLAERLLELGAGAKEVCTTHQQLATEMGTAREVISRILNDFQKHGMIAQSRGRIALVDKSRLHSLSQEA